MDLEQTIIFTNALSLKHRGKEIIEVERFIIKGSWVNEAYEDMAAAGGYSRNYLNSLAAPKLWKLYREALGLQVKKDNLRTLFEKNEYSDFYEESEDLARFIEIAERNSNRISGGEIIIGRVSELEELSKLVNNNKYIEMFGIAGIGKTAIAKKWINWVKKNDEYKSRWEGLYYVPVKRNYSSAEKLIRDLCCELGIKTDEDSIYSELFIDKIIKGKNIVFVDFDNYRIENKVIFELSNYLKSIIDRSHRSCVVFIFREPRFSYGIQLNRESKSNFLQIMGMKASDAEAMLENYNLIGKINWEEFVNGYRGNPLALKMIASHVKNYLDGNFELFYKMKTIFMNPDLESMLNEQYSRLSQQEKIFLHNLSNQYYEVPPTTQFNFEKLCEYFPGGMDQLIQSLRKFENLMLLERVSDTSKTLLWMLPPVVRKYSHMALGEVA